MHLPLVYAYDQVDNVPYLDFVTYETFDTIQIFVKTHERNMFFFHKNRIFPGIAKYYEQGAEQYFAFVIAPHT